MQTGLKWVRSANGCIISESIGWDSVAGPFSHMDPSLAMCDSVYALFDWLRSAVTYAPLASSGWRRSDVTLTLHNSAKAPALGAGVEIHVKLHALRGLQQCKLTHFS